MHNGDQAAEHALGQRPDANYVFHELTRSICPVCRRAVDAQVLLREGKVFLRRRCPEHGLAEALVYGDAEAYVANARFNKPGTIPLRFATTVERGCPHDCGLCPDHQQHACVGIIEVTTACNMDCPLCFADAGAGYTMALEDVEAALDAFVAAEGHAEVVHFSGGEPTVHPQIVAILRAAKQRDIRHVMLNTNGRRIARDDEFLAALAELQPSIYLQFDGFDTATLETQRGEPALLAEKLRALDRLAEIGCDVVLVPAIERGVNEHEVGAIVRFALQHPAVRSVNLQPAFHTGRHGAHDPLRRITIPDLLRLIEEQTEGTFLVSDFVPVPCCFPTCNAVTYAYVDGDAVTPLPRVLEIDRYLDYIANRVVVDPAGEVRTALEALWSSSALPGAPEAAANFRVTCAACGLPAGGLDVAGLVRRMFVVMLQDFMDPWTFNQKNAMKCCKEILLPDGKQVPFCTYNSVGYREQARVQLARRARERARGSPLSPITFAFPHRGI